MRLVGSSELDAVIELRLLISENSVKIGHCCDIYELRNEYRE